MQAKLVPWSSVVGSSITLHQKQNGPVVGQLMLMNVKVSASGGSLQAQHEAVSNRVIKALALLDRVEAFIEHHDIIVPETIYQTDRVIVDAYEFIADLCDIAGYKEVEDEDVDAG